MNTALKLPFIVTLTKPAEIQTTVTAAVGWKGQIDVLVNNARALMGRDAVPVTALELDVWQNFLAINTTAPFLMIREVARHMQARGQGGRIVTIGSDMSKRALRNTAAYAASKFEACSGSRRLRRWTWLMMASRSMRCALDLSEPIGSTTPNGTRR